MKTGYGPNVNIEDIDFNSAANVEEVVTPKWTTLLVRTTLNELLEDYSKTTRIMYWCFNRFGVSWSGYHIRWPFEFWIGFGTWKVEYASTGNGMYARYWFKRKQDAFLFKLTWL